VLADMTRAGAGSDVRDRPVELIIPVSVFVKPFEQAGVTDNPSQEIRPSCELTS